jgi:hypothetical protein
MKGFIRRRGPEIALALAGLALTFGSLFADQLGLGADPLVIGWKQFTGIAAGMLLVVIAAFFFLSHSSGQQ